MTKRKWTAGPWDDFSPTQPCKGCGVTGAGCICAILNPLVSDFPRQHPPNRRRITDGCNYTLGPRGGSTGAKEEGQADD